MTNENTELKERLYEEYEHALFKLVVHAAAEKEGEGLLGELDTSPRPSPAALQRFEQQLNAALRPAKKPFLWTPMDSAKTSSCRHVGSSNHIPHRHDHGASF